MAPGGAGAGSVFCSVGRMDWEGWRWENSLCAADWLKSESLHVLKEKLPVCFRYWTASWPKTLAHCYISIYWLYVRCAFEKLRCWIYQPSFVVCCFQMNKPTWCWSLQEALKDRVLRLWILIHPLSWAKIHDFGPRGEHVLQKNKKKKDALGMSSAAEGGWYWFELLPFRSFLQSSKRHEAQTAQAVPASLWRGLCSVVGSATKETAVFLVDR